LLLPAHATFGLPTHSQSAGLADQQATLPPDTSRKTKIEPKNHVITYVVVFISNNRKTTNVHGESMVDQTYEAVTRFPILEDNKSW
jgi:hypothetical protein